MRPRLRDHPLLRPLVPILRPFVRAARAAARPVAGPVRGRLGRFGPAALARTARWAGGALREIRRRRRDPRLRVAVDVLALWEPRTGVGWSLHQLLAHLAERTDLSLRLYGLSLVRAPGIPEPPEPLPEGPALERVVYEVPDDLVLGQRWLVPFLRWIEPWLIRADRNQVTWAPNYILPPPFRRADLPLVATVHDLAYRKVPWAVRPDTLEAMREVLDRTLHEATLLITPTAAVRDDLVAFGVAGAERVRPIHHGLGMVAAAGRAEEVAAPPAGTPPAYCLHVGTVEPRKNLPALFAAYRRLRAAGASPPPLVLAGQLGWKSEGLRREIDAAAGEGWLLHFGYVGTAELVALYRGATVVALPSWYEGFGLPVVEAMALGAPVLLSDVPVFHEVAGDAALYAPPGDPAAWSAALARLFADPALRADLAARGRRRAERFTWRRAAERAAAVLAEAAER
ncbi:MAG TPA: glycosyltransferase family 1 protein [Thermoanaerobaculia bacterium]